MDQVFILHPMSRMKTRPLYFANVNYQLVAAVRPQNKRPQGLILLGKAFARKQGFMTSIILTLGALRDCNPNHLNSEARNAWSCVQNSG